jgi:hypothetical protein
LRVTDIARAIASDQSVDGQPTAPHDALARPPRGARHQGVPDFIAGSLRVWIRDALASARKYQMGYGGHGLAEEVGLRLQMEPERSRLFAGFAHALTHAPQQELLRIIDTMLEVSKDPQVINLAKLGSHLDAADMAYEVSPVTFRLVRRQDAAEHANSDQAIYDADADTGVLLRRAREAAFRLEPDPDAAYFDAVRAVESAAWGVVCAPSGRPNLGTVWSAQSNDLKTGTPTWQLAFVDKDGVPRDVRPLVEMVGLLKDGHRSRHPCPSWRHQTVEEAQLAVSLATTLVTMFSTGANQSRP